MPKRFPTYEVHAKGDGTNGGGPKRVDKFYFNAPSLAEACMIALRWFGSAQTQFTLWRDGGIVYEFDPNVRHHETATNPATP